MTKVPCGGFKLDNNFLGVNENDELSLTGGSESKAYQQLVTDGNGNTKWEDRLAYYYSKLFVDVGYGTQFIKVSDEVPSWATVDAPMKVWLSDGTNITENPADYPNLGVGDGSFITNYAGFITTDNYEFDGFVFPEKGVYFFHGSDGRYVTGIASADSDTPEITWDGNDGVIKKLDEKLLPEPLILYVHESESGV